MRQGSQAGGKAVRQTVKHAARQALTSLSHCSARRGPGRSTLRAQRALDSRCVPRKISEKVPWLQGERGREGNGEKSVSASPRRGQGKRGAGSAREKGSQGRMRVGGVRPRVRHMEAAAGQATPAKAAALAARLSTAEQNGCRQAKRKVSVHLPHSAMGWKAARRRCRQPATASGARSHRGTPATPLRSTPHGLFRGRRHRPQLAKLCPPAPCRLCRALLQLPAARGQRRAGFSTAERSRCAPARPAVSFLTQGARRPPRCRRRWSPAREAARGGVTFCRLVDGSSGGAERGRRWRAKLHEWGRRSRRVTDAGKGAKEIEGLGRTAGGDPFSQLTGRQPQRCVATATAGIAGAPRNHRSRNAKSSSTSRKCGTNGHSSIPRCHRPSLVRNACTKSALTYSGWNRALRRRDVGCARAVVILVSRGTEPNAVERNAPLLR
jgi:hypothetical protein